MVLLIQPSCQESGRTYG